MRTYLGNIKAIDVEDMRKAVSNQEQHDKAIIENIIAGAAWTAGQMTQSGLIEKAICPLCGQIENDIRHGLWHCQAVKDRLEEQDIRCGINVADPPKMPASGGPPTHEHRVCQSVLATTG